MSAPNERERELGSAGEAATPPTFAEYLGGAGLASKGCSRCAKPATVRVQLAVRPITGKLGGAKALATKGSAMCEPCAVAVYDRVAKVLR